MTAPLRVVGMNNRLIGEHARLVRDEEIRKLPERQAAAERDPAQRAELVRHSAACAFLLAVHRTCQVGVASVELWDVVLTSILSLEVAHMTTQLQTVNYQAVQNPTPESVRIAANWRRDYAWTLEGQVRGHRRLSAVLAQLPLQPSLTPGT